VEQNTSQRECRKCLLIDANAGKEKEMVYRYISELSEAEKAPESLFQKRLEVCRSCEWLSAATCQSCGCFVEVRAAVRKQKCPCHKWQDSQK
jgi:hypothetical protein